MKSLEQYIIEKLKIQNVKNTTEHTLFPETKEELIKMIKEEISKNGKQCNLNHIDVSGITDMESLFNRYGLRAFDGDISEWDVSNVTNMKNMFSSSDFDGNISEWDVSSVEDMSCMFEYSGFKGDISKWDVSSVKNMKNMFHASKFDGDISDWDVSSVENMEHMFNAASFNGDISKWNIKNVKNMGYMFAYAKHFDKDLSNMNIGKVNVATEMFFSSPMQNKKEFWPKRK